MLGAGKENEARSLDESPPRSSDYITIFLVSCGMMLYQVALTRVLSVVVWYHFAFLTVSLVMLGLGAPGVWFAFLKRPLRLLPLFLLASGLTVPLSIVVITRSGTVLFEHGVLFIVAVILPATLSLGGVVCLLLIKATGASVSRMYGADLVGAALGAALIIPLMHLVPTPHLAAASGLLPLLCLLPLSRRWGGVAVVVSAALVALLVSGDLLQVTHCKTYDESGNPPIIERWTPTARLTVFDESFHYLQSQGGSFAWGRGDKFPDDIDSRQYWLEQDGNAGTPITAFDGDLAQVEYLDFDVTTIGYQVFRPKTVAIIGAGGGRDILSALRNRASAIDAIELNAETIRIVSEDLRDFSGDVYNAPGVTPHASEGRSFLTHSEEAYDLIQISLIDSWAASAAGAFALAENNLYTVEAFELYYDKLSARGVISTSRWIRELPRLILLAREALLRQGIQDPARHLAIVSGYGVGTLLVSKRPLVAKDLEAIDEVVEARGFARFHPLREGEQPPVLELHLLTTTGPRLMAELGLNAHPPTDDSPFFFHNVSLFSSPWALTGASEFWAGLGHNTEATRVLRQTMVTVSLLALAMFFAPFIGHLRRPANARHGGGELFRATLYFSAIGAAFMLLENVLLQRFVLYLGHPSFAMTVIIASLLVGMGVGSIAANRVGLAGLQRRGLVVPVLVVGLVLGLPWLFAATLGSPLAVRVVLGCLTLIPLGLLLGLFFPLGMTRFGDAWKPWLWAVNGVFGVVASVLSLALSMEFGYGFVGVLAAGGYIIALACLRVPRS
jgi:hypothetical protein